MPIALLMKLKAGDVDAFAILQALEPVAWFLTTYPVFTATIHQPAQSIMRWALLPLNVIGPATCFATSNKLKDAVPGMEWLWAFTSITYIMHATSALYLEGWHLPVTEEKDPASGNGKTSGKGPSAHTDVTMDPLRWDWHQSYKHWNNPRRLPIKTRATAVPQQASESDERRKNTATWRARALFCAGRLGLVILLWAVYIALDLGAMYLLLPMPRDFDPRFQTYFHFRLDKQSKLRAAHCLQWAWLTYLILSVANALLGLLFVGVLGLDAPDEWPPLYGDVREGYTLRRFWGVFWHRIGSPSQKVIGKEVAKKLGLGGGSGAEKVFLAAFVFFVSSATHVLVVWMTDSEHSSTADAVFLMLNFVGGLFEFVVKRIFERVCGGRRGDDGKEVEKRFGVWAWARFFAWRILGFSWVFAFFYVTVPPWQWPMIRAEVAKRVPDVKINVNLGELKRHRAG